MPNFKVTTRTVTTTSYDLVLTGADIAELFCEAKGISPKGMRYTAVFNVPGGGDYSNCKINLDEEPIVVRIWTEKEEVE